MDLLAALKQEGNVLFTQQNWSAAHDKYSEAIQSEGGNKVPELFCNRAACYLHMRKFRSAVQDAKEAIDLNPNYVKAWGRLGAAHVELQEHNKAIEAFERAIALIDALPNQTAADLKLKAQYEVAMGTEKHNFGGHHVIIQRDAMGNAPWDIAEEMKPGLVALGPEGLESSAWVISSAYKVRIVYHPQELSLTRTMLLHQEFKEGLDIMSLQTVVTAPSGPGVQARTGAVVAISNGLIMDDRCIHLTEEFHERYNVQVNAEARTVNAWEDTSDEERVKRELLERLQTKGWDDVRPALSITIRALIIHAHFATAYPDFPKSISLLQRVIRFLEWGRKEFENVDKLYRGIIFESTFLIGVKKLYGDVLVQAYGESQTSPTPYCTPEDILNAADSVLDLARSLQDSGPPPRENPGFYLAFYRYPIAEALSFKGYYHMCKAREFQNDPAQSGHHLSGSHHLYMQAADRFPKDDEKRPFFRRSAIAVLFRFEAPLKMTLPLLESLRLEYPRIKPLWNISSLASQGRDEILENLIEFEASARRGLENGRYTMDSTPVPSMR